MQNNEVSSVVNIFTWKPLESDMCWEDTASMEVSDILDIKSNYHFIRDDMRHSILLSDGSVIDDDLEYILNDFFKKFGDINIYPWVDNIPLKKTNGKYTLKWRSYLTLPKHVYNQFLVKYTQTGSYLWIVE